MPALADAEADAAACSACVGSSLRAISSSGRPCACTSQGARGGRRVLQPLRLGERRHVRRSHHPVAAAAVRDPACSAEAEAKAAEAAFQSDPFTVRVEPWDRFVDNAVRWRNKVGTRNAHVSHVA
jgi:hypothetical protein